MIGFAVKIFTPQRNIPEIMHFQARHIKNIACRIHCAKARSGSDVIKFRNCVTHAFVHSAIRRGKCVNWIAKRILKITARLAKLHAKFIFIESIAIQFVLKFFIE